MDCTVLCFYLVTALAPRCWGFTVDETTVTTFRMQSQSFGSSVVQTRNGVIAGAPLERGKVNETGKLYQCFYKTGSCEEISMQVPADAVNMSLGLTLVARDSKVLACGPTVHRACGKNMYVNGYCFLLDENLQKLQQFPEILPECSYHPTDIAFLIDGSGSIHELDFERMKVFVSEVINRLSGRNTQFALAQFSNKFEEHFDFNTADPAGSVMWISQIRGLTHTANAIQRVVREIFVPSKGARNGATRILLVITDGRKTDRLSYRTVVQEAERAGIIRYAIGVGDAFWDSRARKELDDIASEPDDEHVIAVHNFDALKGIQDQLQDKIFAIEGTQSQSSSSFQMEMAQEGFSASLTLDGSVLGAVGAYDWSGGVILYPKNNREPHFINESSTAKDMNSAYFGYSSQQVQFDGKSGVIVGAPRYEYVGKVVLLETDVKSVEWQTKMEAVGEQVGSYFGAALCSVDLDGDMNTDLVLVGAPLYYDAVSGGRVYVCHIKEKALLCDTRLKGQVGHVLGRFGASMAEIGDITGDGWTDVAIGAPLEDENVGALYIFRGKRTSIVPQYIQRIVGQKFSGGFLYFGQAVSGGLDLTGDGLKDIAVGQQGQVLLLRSRPVLRLAVSITFNPTLIPISAFQCQGQEHLEKVASEAQVCFTVAKATQDKLGTILSDLQYSLTLDSERTKIRASFSSNSALLTSSLEIGLEQKCENHWIFLPVCTEDTLTPISLRVNYSLVGRPIIRAKNLQPILSQDSQKVYLAQLPFEKNCGADMKCEDNLRTRFNFSGLDTLVVGLNPELNITAFIQNDGEDSYSTILQFFFPMGLSYRKVTLLQSSRKVVSVKCHSSPASEEDANRNATCNVNHPIFWSGAEAVFIATFDVSPDTALGDTLQVVTRANSENDGITTKDMVHQAVLPVKYAVYIIATGLDESTKYVNFTAGQEQASWTVEHLYEVKNLHHRSIPISVMFQVPVKLKGIQLWDVVQVVPSKPQLATCILEEERMGTKDFPVAEQQPSVDCSVSTCRMIRCDILSLEIRQPVVFQIKGNVSFQWASQIQQKKVTLVSSAQISYNEQKYTQREGFAQAQVQTVVERLKSYNYLPVIIGSTVGGLFLLALISAGLYKIGFFKRQYKELLNVGGAGEEAQEAEASQDTDVSVPPRSTIS